MMDRWRRRMSISAAVRAISNRTGATFVSVQAPRWRRDRQLAQPPVTRYNRSMIETTLPLAPELWATAPAPEPAPLLEQLATLRIANAALQERLREAAIFALYPTAELNVYASTR